MAGNGNWPGGNWNQNLNQDRDQNRIQNRSQGLNQNGNHNGKKDIGREGIGSPTGCARNPATAGLKAGGSDKSCGCRFKDGDCDGIGR